MRQYNCLVAPRQHGKTTLMVELMKSVARASHIMDPVINLCSDTAERLFKLYSGEMDRVFGHYPSYNWSQHSPGKSIILRRPEGDRAIINIFGSDQNFYGPKGTASHINILDEMGRTKKGFLEESVIRSTDKTNGVVVAGGTVEPNHWYKIFNFAKRSMVDPTNPWFAFYFKFGSEYSKEVHPSEAKRRKLCLSYDMSDPDARERFDKEMMCNWFAVTKGKPLGAAYYRAEEQGRVGKFPYDPRFSVGTAWDNGQATAVWFWQYVHGIFRFIDFKEWRNSDYEVIGRDIKKWYDDRRAKHGIHVFPHTMRERQQVMGNRELVYIVMDFMDTYRRCDGYIINKKPHNIDTKLQHTRAFLKRCVFDLDSCFHGLTCIQNYERAGNKEKGISGNSMVKNEYSHGAEAFSEVAWAWANDRFSSIGGGPDDSLTSRSNNLGLYTPENLLWPF